MASPKAIKYTVHAMTSMRERGLDEAWIERTVLVPEWAEPDRLHLEVERRFSHVPERGGRVLRVAVVETSEEIRIISAFLDRRARRPQ